jgi:hypothetical protein
MRRSIRLKIILVLMVALASVHRLAAQCCAGGSGSPVAGGTTQGVLSLNQFEISTSFQFVSTDKFFSKDSPDTAKSFDSFSSTYQYTRFAYGITENFTMSAEGGYYHSKKEIGLNENPNSTYNSKGIADLILFPRYNIFKRVKGNSQSEITLGLGFKIPLGSYNDSIGNLEPFSGMTFYFSKPTAVQLSSGAHDLIFYTFLLRGYMRQNFKLFANALYIKKGWNANGEKMGDFASVSLFGGKTLFKNFGIILQARYEWLDSMRINESVAMFGKPSTYFPGGTGYKKVFIAPQLSFTKGKFTIYTSTDFPVYQYVNSHPFYTQVGSQHQTTVGLAFRFLTRKCEVPGDSANTYSCPMHPEITSAKPSACPKCGMDLEKSKEK